MKKTQIIKEIIGKRLEPYGFKYLKTDGPCRFFIREIKNVQRYYEPDNDTVTQYINIQESNFSKRMTVGLFTDVYGFEVEHRLEQIKEYSETKWLEYTDEESYKEQLKKLVELIIQYGLAELDKRSIEEKVIPTKVMAETLYNEHKKLDQIFVDKYQVNINPKSEGDIEEWYQLIKEIIIKSTEESYEEAKELLLQIAAFIGERACELCEKKWILPAHIKNPAVVGGFPYSKFSPLALVVEAWKYKCDEKCYVQLVKIFELMKKDFTKQNEDK